MKLILATICFQIIFAYLVMGQRECVPDPCESAECPRFLNADCRIDPENCTVKFFWGERNVSDQCAVPTCDTRQCGKSRDCIENVFPPSCPQDNPECRQYIKTRCMLRPQSRPLTCNDVKCEAGMTCHFRERGDSFPPVVRCIPSVPKDCSELKCDDGSRCVLQGRRPFCVPSVTTSPPTTTKPNDCSELNCKQDEMCIISGTTPTCVPFTTPTPAPDCSEFECKDDEMCVLREMSPICIPATPFTTVTTPTSTTPNFNVMAESCSELDCLAFFTVCNQVNANFAVCEEPTECTDEFNERCMDIHLVCGGTSFDTVTCVVPSSCNQLTCNEEQNCIEFTSGNNIIAQCIENTGPMFSLRCEDLSCPEGQGCLANDYPSLNLIFASCIANDVLDSIAISIELASRIPQTCSSLECGNESCIDIQRNENQVLQSCIPQNCLTNMNCSAVFDQCVSLTDLDLLAAPESICVPTVFQALVTNKSCKENERVCSEGLECQDVYIDGNLIGTVCNTPVPPLGRTCDEIECIGENVGCVINEIPSRPDLAQLASCIDNFDVITTSIISGLRALGLI
ncbi:uncharacterized protein LOC135333567 [Halichondria panicea]|uniref:uncharacterized protein LOC135333567 n=1 Tax=Halichondria panicea TaxID=6063 RepID=UPI00312BB988